MMKCIYCDSESILAHTSDELRKLHLLIWQCFECKEWWETGWDVDLPPTKAVIRHGVKYEDEILEYIRSND